MYFHNSAICVFLVLEAWNSFAGLKKVLFLSSRWDELVSFTPRQTNTKDASLVERRTKFCTPQESFFTFMPAQNRCFY